MFIVNIIARFIRACISVQIGLWIGNTVSKIINKIKGGMHR